MGVKYKKGQYAHTHLYVHVYVSELRDVNVYVISISFSLSRLGVKRLRSFVGIGYNGPAFVRG